MSLESALNRAIQEQEKLGNEPGANALEELGRQYRDLVMRGTVLPAPEKPESPVGKFLREARSGQTQEEIAVLAKISVNTLQKLERGDSKTYHIGTLARLSAALKLDPMEHTNLMNLMVGQSSRRRRGSRKQQ